MAIKKISEFTEGVFENGDVILAEKSDGTPKKIKWVHREIPIVKDGNTILDDEAYALFISPSCNAYVDINNVAIKTTYQSLGIRCVDLDELPMMSSGLEYARQFIYGGMHESQDNPEIAELDYAFCAMGKVNSHTKIVSFSNIYSENQPNATATLVLEGFYSEEGDTPEPEPQDKCSNPTITQNGNSVTISCDTLTATIMYRLGETGDYLTYTTSFAISEDVTVYAYATASGYTQSDVVQKLCEYTEPQPTETLPTPVVSQGEGGYIEGLGNYATITFVNGDDFLPYKDNLYMIVDKDYLDAYYEANQTEPPQGTPTTEDGDYIFKVTDIYQDSFFTENSNFGLYAIGDGTILPSTFSVKFRCEGYLDSEWGSCTYVQKKVKTPTLSLSRNASQVNGTIGNKETGATYYYRVNNVPTPETGTLISGDTFSFTSTGACIVYVVGFKEGYTDSDAVQKSISSHTAPKVPTPTLTLTRSGATVNGTIGSTDSSATYRYKVGSAPTSNTDGTLISGTTFSFSNSNAITVYVRGFRTGYDMSDAVSKSVSSYTPPTPKCATPEISQTDNTVTFTCDTSGATIHYSGCGKSGTCSSGGSVEITESGTMTAYATASGYTQSNTASMSCTYAEEIPDPFISFSVWASDTADDFNFYITASQNIDDEYLGAALSCSVKNETNGVELAKLEGGHLTDDNGSAQIELQNATATLTILCNTNEKGNVKVGDVCSLNWTISLSGYVTNTGSIRATVL